MAPTIHLIRHAQGFHNLGSAYHHIQDPDLTPLGIEQCQTLAKDFPYHNKVTKVIASPLKRTILTAHHSLEPVIKSRKLTILALPTLQETGQAPCDTGLDPPALAASLEKEGLNVDVSLVEPGWNNKTVLGKWGNSSYAISARAKEARQAIRNIAREMVQNDDEGDIAVVSHGGLLHYLTEDWEDANRPEAVSWANTEYRSYKFVAFDSGTATPKSVESASAVGSSIGKIEDWPRPEIGGKYKEFVGLIPFTDDFENATLVETEESRARRGKGGVAVVGREKQEELCREVVGRWERNHEAVGWKQF